MIIGLLSLCFGAICLILSYLIYSREEEVILHNKITITKEYTMKLVVPEIITAVLLLDNQSQLDNIRGWSRRLFNWYIIGDNGYYVISKRSGIMTSYQNYSLVPKKYKHKFDMIECLEKPD